GRPSTAVPATRRLPYRSLPETARHGGAVTTSELPRVIVVTGPTAVGKSALALELADRLGGEIVSADSRQGYRYMDMGTAKPSLPARAAVPHHLVDAV